MKITTIDVIPYRIPYHKTHNIATLTLSSLENIVLHVHTDSGVSGIGEVVTEAKWNSTVLEAHQVLLEKYLVPVLIGRDPLDIRGAWRAMNKALNGQYATKAGLDIALHDLVGRALGIPAYTYLGGAASTTITVEGPGFGIGFMGPEEAAEFALRGISGGCRQIEVKTGHPAGPDHDLSVVRAVHEACGPDVSLKIDVTEAYTYKTALQYLPLMADLGVEWVEQPLERHRVREIAMLRKALPVKIALEESVGHLSDVIEVGRLGAADGIHVKLAMLGGLTAARDVAVVCDGLGLEVLPGSSTPSGIGLAATHQFAATVAKAGRGCHGSPLGRAVDDLLVNPVPAFPATIELTEAPGLGVEVDWDKVERYAVR